MPIEPPVLPPTVDPLPIPPSSTDPDNFDPRADAFLGALPDNQGQMNTLGVNVYDNALKTFESAGLSITASETAVPAADAAVAASVSAVAANTDIQKYYLGAKTSAPTVDNQGNALVTGTWYTNTTAGSWYWWNGTTWVLGAGTPTVDFTTQVIGKPTTASGYGITDVVKQNVPNLGNVDLNTCITSGFFRIDTPTNAPVGTPVGLGQLIVSRNQDTIIQIVTGYNNGLSFFRQGTPTNIGGGGDAGTGSTNGWQIWRPLGNQPVRIITDTGGHMYGETQGGLNTVNIIMTAGVCSKFMPGNPLPGDTCTVICSNARSDNNLYVSPEDGQYIMGLNETMILDSPQAVVTFVLVQGYGWRIKS